MKVFKNLVVALGITFCMISCSQHTTCAAYGANTYQINENQNEINVQSANKNVDWM